MLNTAEDTRQEKLEQSKQQTIGTATEGSEKKISWNELFAMQKDELYATVKGYGPAGIISIIIVGGIFWALYIPDDSTVIVYAYHQTTGEWISPTLILFPVGATKVAVTALGFWTAARFFLPVRLGAALAITPWVKKNIVDKLSSRKE
ncbi:hypothetical protein GUITHDRAFT_136890 [Guillardia theta CCMP2712]|uniref:Uncharacterized protein n=1 Tax=Guillardia theta (strain CCMP2712) TaxID=905079 RepID=L1JIS4_GUITC|nr:hypothetical protein GUITHDRAFT_136890 [Guillardia theta CCMP2712]EKX48386.1 hypothetical protein GUITHDRAFT_136890 [Guillardia theta CCMP2712]|eukprot:XP_005835366.1 hypothetical protein GUITHDRAFT_136890 [Guillardia theta CCMP2712]